MLLALGAATALPLRAQFLTYGAEGKDAPWVPTPDEVAVRMLAMARTTAADRVVDLGSGDGRIPTIAAARFGARALGIEYEKEMVEHARRRAREAGLADRVEFRQGDVLEEDFSDASVVTVYLTTSLNIRLRPRILALRPGTRVVAHEYGFGEEWEADEVGFEADRRVLLWIVPAQVAGIWRLEGGELAIRQRFQRIEGSYRRGGETQPLRGARLRGDRVSFALAAGRDERSFYGRVTGAALQGVATDGESSDRFHATRQA